MEIKKIIDIEYKRAKEILKKYQDSLTELAKLLLKKEVIFKEDLEKILGERKWPNVKKVKIQKSEK